MRRMQVLWVLLAGLLAGYGSTCSTPTTGNDRNGNQGDTLGDTLVSSWEALPQPPAELPGRNNHVVATVGGKIYLGLGNDNDFAFNDWWRYDPATGNWERLADFPGKPRNLAFSFVINGKIYVGGGDSLILRPHYADVYVYDPATDAWQGVASLPYALSGAAGTSDGTYGYVFGGATGWGGVSNLILRYDPGQDRWDTLTTYPGEGRWGPVLVYHLGYLYAGTGRTSDWGGDNLADMQRYNLATGEWEPIAGYPFATYDAWAVATGQRIFVLGGHAPQNDFTDQFYYYSVSEDRWKPVPQFPGGPRNNLIGGVVGSYLYAGLGVTPALTFPRDWWRLRIE